MAPRRVGKPKPSPGLRQATKVARTVAKPRNVVVTMQEGDVLKFTELAAAQSISTHELIGRVLRDWLDNA